MCIAKDSKVEGSGPRAVRFGVLSNSSHKGRNLKRTAGHRREHGHEQPNVQSIRNLIIRFGPAYFIPTYLNADLVTQRSTIAATWTLVSLFSRRWLKREPKSLRYLEGPHRQRQQLGFIVDCEISVCRKLCIPWHSFSLCLTVIRL